MDRHVIDQWSLSHLLWGWVLGIVVAPRTAGQWPWLFGLLFACGWELWENVIEVALGTYAADEYGGDSVVNSLVDIIPTVVGVVWGMRSKPIWHYNVPSYWPHAMPVWFIGEAWACWHGVGIHSCYLGCRGCVCDLRSDPWRCGQSYALRVALLLGSRRGVRSVWTAPKTVAAPPLRPPSRFTSALTDALLSSIVATRDAIDRHIFGVREDDFGDDEPYRAGEAEGVPCPECTPSADECRSEKEKSS